MLRRAKDQPWRTALHELPLMQDCYPMTQGCHGEEIVRNVENGHIQFTVEAGKQTEDLRLGDGIKRTRGFISDQQSGAVQDRHGDDDALGLAHTQLRGPAPQEFIIAGQANAGECRLDCGVTTLFGAMRVRAPGLLQLGPNAKGGVQRTERASQDDTNVAPPE